jgi:hypothetical protein
MQARHPDPRSVPRLPVNTPHKRQPSSTNTQRRLGERQLAAPRKPAPQALSSAAARTPSTQLRKTRVPADAVTGAGSDGQGARARVTAASAAPTQAGAWLTRGRAIARGSDVATTAELWDASGPSGLCVACMSARYLDVGAVLSDPALGDSASALLR